MRGMRAVPDEWGRMEFENENDGGREGGECAGVVRMGGAPPRILPPGHPPGWGYSARMSAGAWLVSDLPMWSSGEMHVRSGRTRRASVAA